MTGCLSMIMIDQIVSVALPTLQRDLPLTTAILHWVVNAYLLLLAVLVAFGGRLAALLGAERTFRAAPSPRTFRVGTARRSSRARPPGRWRGADGALHRRAAHQRLRRGERGKAMGI